MNRVKTSFKNMEKNTLALFGIAMLIFIVMAMLAPKSFLGLANLQGMCIQFPEFGILAFGMMLAMISGGIDLSLVGIANLSGILCATIVIRMGGSGQAIICGMAGAVVVGAFCGIFNGILIGYLKIPPMLVTLCGLQLYTGIGLAITRGPALTGLPETFSLIANGAIGGIPLALLTFIAVAVVVSFLLKSTVYGQHVSYMGTNDVASRYSGMDNLKVTVKTYLISGVLGSIGGILMLSHYNSAKSDYGSSYTLLTLLIVVLGGTDPDGGRGKVLGVSLAVIVLQLVSSAFNILRINAFVKTFVWGLMLLLIMVVTKVMDSRKITR